MHPDALLQKDQTDDNLDHVAAENDGIDRMDIQPRRIVESKGQRHLQKADENAVKEEGDEGLSAASDGSVFAVMIKKLRAIRSRSFCSCAAILRPFRQALIRRFVIISVCSS